MHLRQITGLSYPPPPSSSLMLIHQVDMDQLSRRSKDTPWRWDKVEEWLDAAGTAGPRAMCVLAGAGTGKSTISAAIWSQVGGGGGGLDPWIRDGPRVTECCQSDAIWH